MKGSTRPSVALSNPHRMLADSILQDCSDCACLVDGDPVLLSFQTVLTTPVLYSLELTSLCNNRCPGCSNVFTADKSTRSVLNADRPLDLEGWRRVLDIVARHAQRLKLTGGEPTLHPQFAEIVAEISRRNIPFTLFTNGRWRCPEELIAMLRDVPQCTGLLISLHGAEAIVHEAFSGMQGSFVETVTNILRATAAGLRVATSTVITRQNAYQVADVIFLAEELGVQHALFNRYLGPPSPQLEPSTSQLCKAVARLDELARLGAPMRFGNCIPQCFTSNSSVGCLAGSAYATIDPWGNLRPCNHDGLICGNLLKRSIESIWHGEAMNRWRDVLPESCVACAVLNSCRIGCRAAARQWGAGTDPLSGCVSEVSPPKIPLFTTTG